MQCITNDNLKNVHMILPHAEFAYESSVNCSTKRTPFKVDCVQKLQYVLYCVPLLEEAQVYEDWGDAYVAHVKRFHFKEFTEDDEFSVYLRKKIS